MGETSGEIKQEIEEQREQLGEHLHQVETQAKQALDWRARFDERPMAMIGLAFGGGLLASTLLGGGGSDTRHRSTNGSSSLSGGAGTPSSPEGREMSETVDNIRGALLGLAAREVRSLLATALPGFEEEYREATQKRGASREVRLDESPSPAREEQPR